MPSIRVLWSAMPVCYDGRERRGITPDPSVCPVPRLVSLRSPSTLLEIARIVPYTTFPHILIVHDNIWHNAYLGNIFRKISVRRSLHEGYCTHVDDPHNRR
jgi:hypothetical protein